MHLEYAVTQAVGELICGAISNGLPTEDQAEFSGVSEQLLSDLLDELTPADLRAALERAAERLNESDYDSEDESTEADA